jgi:prepilin-type N-terminal cleavage/methylation domain-containing protein
MTRRGFTLIEVLIAFSVMAVIFGCSLINVRSCRAVENRMDVEVFGNSLVDFITYSKKYCRDSNTGGYIYFLPATGTVQLTCSSKSVKKLKMPQGFRYLCVNKPTSKIYIDNLGFTSDACTISFEDRKGALHYVTVSVGTAYADFKG